MKRGLTLFVVFFLTHSLLAQEDRSKYNSYFEQAAAEFRVPADVLRGVAFAETRWSQLEWAAGDTASCAGMPHPFGIMSLWDNNYFGHSLREAARLISTSPDSLKYNVLQNIRGGAALLRYLYDEQPRPEGTAGTDIESWRNAIAAYSGIPQVELSQQHALDVYSFMNSGYHQYGIEFADHPVNIEAVRAAVRKIQQTAKAKLQKSNGTTGVMDQPDYPGAKWASAYPGHWYDSGYDRKFVVIHDMEGYYLSTISYFQMSSTQASIYYCVNGLKDNAGDAPAGEITQMVEEKYYAWHVVCWNLYMFGIEHEGFVSNPAWYTDAMYKSSAKLTSYLCNKYGIPEDRNHIIAHSEWQNQTWKDWMVANYPQIGLTCNNHTDPGVNWNWSYYMQLVTGNDTIAPKVVSNYPPANGTNIPGYRDIVVTFDYAMDEGRTSAAFHISPALAGSQSWSTDARILTFHPSAFLPSNTTYSVTVDTSARNVAGTESIDGNDDGLGGDPYQFSFTTAPPDTTPPEIVASYPAAGSDGIPITSDVIVRFDEPLQYTSLAGKIYFQDTTGLNLPYSSGKLDSSNGRGVLTLSPNALRRGNTYQVRLKLGLADYYGNATTADKIIRFTASSDSVRQGIVSDNFESNSHGWTQPVGTVGTTGVDTYGTSFSLVSDKKRSGTYSGRLSYAFSSDSGGVVVLQETTRPILDSYSVLGIWVYGDFSGNDLAAIFDPSDQIVTLGPVNWYGWKFVVVDLASISGPGKKFISFTLAQEVAGEPTGTLFFDDMQVDPTITNVENASAALPAGFALEQNYPNPFNPSTTIRYRLAAASSVTLTVYDVLGREVALIAQGRQEAGDHVAVLDGAHLTSGLYFYVLRSGGEVAARKMILLK